MVSFVFRELQFRWKWPQYSLKKRLDGPQGQSGRLREDSNLLLPQGIELWFTMQVGSRGVGWAAPGHWVTKVWHWWPKGGSSYFSGAVDADYSPSLRQSRSVRGEEPHPTSGDPVAQNSGSKGVNLEKQSPFLRCECRAWGMNGSGWVCP